MARTRPGRGTVAQEVEYLHAADLVDGGNASQPPGLDQAVAVRVEPPAHLVFAGIQQIGGTVAGEVDQNQPARVELAIRSEHRCAGHQHRRTEPPVAQLRPVLEPAVADPYLIGEPVAGHVGEEEIQRGVFGQRWVRGSSGQPIRNR
jgi:hypothetical protein